MFKEQKKIRLYLFSLTPRYFYSHFLITVTNVAFTLNGFDDQERNLTFVKTDFIMNRYTHKPHV